ncbi:PAS domain-containing protein, partial [Pseudomonas sp. SIMBA_044]|uniref:PAS domain-containing protein n=1 Tax=Pseudomonas sp. SIMBA_044 TaxID=3085785 RepID=UPI0039793A4F
YGAILVFGTLSAAIGAHGSAHRDISGALNHAVFETMCSAALRLALEVRASKERRDQENQMPRKSKSIIDDDNSAVISESRKGLFFAAVQISRTAMIVTDPGKSDNPIVFANQAFLDLTEFTLDEVLGRNCRFLQGEQTDKVTLQRVEEALKN